MTIQEELKQAAANFERLLNLLPNQLDVSLDKVNVSTVAETKHLYQIRIVSTHPVQIYP